MPRSARHDFALDFGPAGCHIGLIRCNQLRKVVPHRQRQFRIRASCLKLGQSDCHVVRYRTRYGRKGTRVPSAHVLLCVYRISGSSHPVGGCGGKWGTRYLSALAPTQLDLLRLRSMMWKHKKILYDQRSQNFGTASDDVELILGVRL